MLVARLTETSLGRLEVCTVDGYGRCIQTLEKFAVGELLAKEKPLVLGSSDGLSLAEVCCLSGGDVTVDASDSGVISNTLPETNIAPENRVSPIFRGYVRFGEGIFKLFLLFTPKPLWFPDSPSFQTKKTHQKSGDDLIAACVLLERRKEKSEHDAEVRCAVAAELDRSDENSSNSLDPLIPYLSSEVNENLEHDSGTSGVLNAMLRKWRGICDVNAETWVELIESSGHVRFLFGLFGALAMAEHSCDPNARVEWDQKEQTMRLVATKAIDAKQRVSRSYLDVGALLSSSSLRQDALQSDWHFTCRCTRCQDEYQKNVTSVVQAHTDAAWPFLSGKVDLQHVASAGGLPLDKALKMAVRTAAAACAAADLPMVGTLQFLQQLVANEDVSDDEDIHPRVLRLHCPEAQEASPKRCKR